MRFSNVATVFAFLAIPTLASAHAGNDNPNVVHACIGNVSLSVRIVGVSGSCISSPASKAETPFHWAIQGPPGTNGTNGIDGVSVTSVALSPGDANCPNGGSQFTSASGITYACNGGGTRADGPCFDNTNRYIDCRNGTVTDTVTGLIWLKQADCLANNSWAAANGAAAGLKDGDCRGNLTDKSSPGDWRLPTKDEWSATIARAVALGCTGDASPSLTNDAGTACYRDGSTSSFAGVALGPYWSSTTLETDPPNAWVWEPMLDHEPSPSSKPLDLSVWPVRGGRR